jgi:hypothetical protein
VAAVAELGSLGPMTRMTKTVPVFVALAVITSGCASMRSAFGPPTAEEQERRREEKAVQKQEAKDDALGGPLGSLLYIALQFANNFK